MKAVVLKGLLLYMTLPTHKKYTVYINLTGLDEETRIQLRESLLDLIDRMDRQYAKKSNIIGRSITVSYKNTIVVETDDAEKTTKTRKKRIAVLEMVPIPSTLINTIAYSRTTVYEAVNRYAFTISEISVGKATIKKTFMLPLASTSAFMKVIDYANKRYNEVNNALETFKNSEYIRELAEILKTYNVKSIYLVDVEVDISDKSIDDIITLLKRRLTPLPEATVRLVPIALDSETIKRLADYVAKVRNGQQENEFLVQLEEILDDTREEMASKVLENISEKLVNVIGLLISKGVNSTTQELVTTLYRSALELNMPDHIVNAYKVCMECVEKRLDALASLEYFKNLTGKEDPYDIANSLLQG